MLAGASTTIGFASTYTQPGLAQSIGICAGLGQHGWAGFVAAFMLSAHPIGLKNMKPLIRSAIPSLSVAVIRSLF